jgi:hypothetical protein
MKTKLMIVLTLISLFLCQDLLAQTNYQDVIYLKNGSIIKGMIIENMPGATVKLQTADGNLFVYNYTDIEKFGKEAVVAKASVIKSEKNPAVSCLLSFLLPGGGQYYNGEITKGAIMTGVYVGSYVLVLAAEEPTPIIIGGIAFFGDYLWSIIDAPISANRINKSNRDLASIKIGKESYLSLSPDFKLLPTPTLCGATKLDPVVGMKLKLSL